MFLATWFPTTYVNRSSQIAWQVLGSVLHWPMFLATWLAFHDTKAKFSWHKPAAEEVEGRCFTARCLKNLLRRSYSKCCGKKSWSLLVFKRLLLTFLVIVIYLVIKPLAIYPPCLCFRFSFLVNLHNRSFAWWRFFYYQAQNALSKCFLIQICLLFWE